MCRMQPPVNGYLEAVHRKTAPTIPAVIPAVKTAVEVAHGTHRHFRSVIVVVVVVVVVTG